jgi:hypothetical protein
MRLLRVFYSIGRESFFFTYIYLEKVELTLVVNDLPVAYH